jgi:hypothetical protein
MIKRHPWPAIVTADPAFLSLNQGLDDGLACWA